MWLTVSLIGYWIRIRPVILQKPIGLLNINGYYDEELGSFDQQQWRILLSTSTQAYWLCMMIQKSY